MIRSRRAESFDKERDRAKRAEPNCEKGRIDCFARRSSQVLFLMIFLVLVLPMTAHSQGLEVGGGWIHSTGDNGTDGFNLGVAWWFTKRVTLAADYDSAWDTTTITTFTFSQFGGVATKAHLQDLLFGPRIFFSTHWTDRHKLNPFGEVQIGLSHLNETLTQLNSPTISASDTGFTWMMGGGTEYLFSPHWSGRVDVDLMRTHLANQGQSHLRFVLGIRYTFGSRERKSASATPSSDEPASTQQVLMGLEQRKLDAFQKVNIAVLENILSDSYVDTDATGHQTDKKGVIADLTSGALKINSMTLSGMQVYQYGSSATVTGRMIQEGVFKGEPLADSIVFTDTFHMQDGAWKVVASHRTRTKTPALYRPSEDESETPLWAGNDITRRSWN